MSPVDLKFVFVVGKGGVGKSAVSAALALTAAARGKRVLVAMCNTQERLSRMLECQAIGPDIITVAPGIDAVNMQPTEAMREYGMMVLRVKALHRVIFDNKYVSAFLHGTPGLDAWAMLGKAQFHALERRPDGSPRYDLVIVDAPATGHGLGLLRVPRVIIEVAPPGLLRRDAEKAWALFSDPTRAGVMLVTLPEEMPTNETIDLHRILTRELGLPICGLAVNAASEPLFEDAQARAITQMSDDTSLSPELTPLIVASRRRIVRDRVQRTCMDRLRSELSMEPIVLPRLATGELQRRDVQRLANELEVQLP